MKTLLGCLFWLAVLIVVVATWPAVLVPVALGILIVLVTGGLVAIAGAGAVFLLGVAGIIGLVLIGSLLPWLLPLVILLAIVLIARGATAPAAS